MRRSGKIALAALAAVAVVALAAVIGVLLAGRTASGRLMLERLTGTLSGGEVQIAGLGGSLPSELTLATLTLRDRRGVWLTARGIRLRWHPLALVERKVLIDDVHAASVTVTRAPVAAGAARAKPLRIPIIDVSHATIDRLDLGADLAGHPASLKVSGALQLRSMQDLDADLDAMRIDGDGHYVLRMTMNPQRIDARLRLHEPAGGPLENLVGLADLGGLSVSMTLAGPRQAEVLGLRVDAGGLHAAAGGTVDLTTRAADVHYSIDASAMRPRSDLAWTKIEAHGRWRGAIASPSVDGRLDVVDLRIGTAAAVGELQARLTGAAGSLGLTGTLSGLRVPGPRPDLLGDQPVTFAAQMRLNSPTRPLEFQVAQRMFALRGTAVTAGTVQTAVNIQIPDVAPFAALGGQDLHGGAAIKIDARRRTTATSFGVDAKFSGLRGTSTWLLGLGGGASVHIDGTVGSGGVDIAGLRVSSPRMTLTGAGSAVRDVLQAKWSLTLPDLSAFGPRLAGSLHASGGLAGPSTGFSADAGITARVAISGSAPGTLTAVMHADRLPSTAAGFVRIGGVFDAAPLRVAIAWAPDRAGVTQAVIRHADWRSVQVSGNFSRVRRSAGGRGRLNLAVAALSDLNDILGVKLGGALGATLSWAPNGTHANAVVQGNFTHLTLGRFAGNAQVSASGPLNALAVQIAAQAPDLTGAVARFTSAATLDLGARRLRFSAATLDYRGNTVHLLGPAAILFANGVQIDTLHLGTGVTTFEAGGRLTPVLALHARLRGSAPVLVNAFVPGLLSGGRIDASAALSGTVAAPAGELRWDATGIRAGGAGAYGLPALDFHGTATLLGASARVAARIGAGKNSAMSLEGTVPLNADGSLNAKITGSVDVGLAGPILEARGIAASGVLHLDAALTGSARAPQVTGEVRLAGGQVRDYASGVNLEHIDALLVGAGDGLDIKKFTATAAPGSVSMTGHIGLLKPGIPLDLDLTAKNAQPIASNLLTVNADASLHIGGTLRHRIEVGGSVHVHRAVIGIPNALPPSVAVLDVRRRGQKAAAAAPVRPPLVIGLALDVIAPRQILVRGRGLDAELGGQMHLSGTTDTPTVSGGFSLQRGSFTLAANKLSFTSGRVGFNGAGLRHRIDPSLDFTAQTTAENLTTTLRITGLADAPIFTFTSSPPPSLPQDEIIARLLFGANATQLSAFQAAQLGAALATLSGVGGGVNLNPLAKLQQVLGLDRLTVGTAPNTVAGVQRSSSAGASIAAGRYVSSRVYVEAKQTTTGSSQIQVNVDLTKHLTLETRLGNGAAITQGTTPENDPGSSIGLKYQLEY